jgi:hypothetical protein
VKDTPLPSFRQNDPSRMVVMPPLPQFLLPSLNSMDTLFGLSPSLDLLSSLNIRSTELYKTSTQLLESIYATTTHVSPIFKNTPFSQLPDEVPNVSHIHLIGSPEFPEVQVECTTPDDHQRFLVVALLDSGAGGCYVDSNLVEKHDLQPIPLDIPLKVFNADGTENKHGTITQSVNLLVKIGEHRERIVFNVTRLGKKPMIIGIPWFRQHNPEVD